MSNNVPEVQSTPTGAMIRTLGLVSAICGLLIVSAYEGTLKAVAANKKITTERSVQKVIPNAKTVVEYNALTDGKVEVAKSDTVPVGAIRFYGGYDADGKLVGMAAEGGGKGYADVVRIMVGIAPDGKTVNGMSVVNMRETPGIGDKILVDKKFLANFDALDVALSTNGKTLANAVKAVKHGTKVNPWQIDAIAGATITSRAVAAGVNEAAGALLPRVTPQLEQLRNKQ